MLRVAFNEAEKSVVVIIFTFSFSIYFESSYIVRFLSYRQQWLKTSQKATSLCGSEGRGVAIGRKTKAFEAFFMSFMSWELLVDSRFTFSLRELRQSQLGSRIKYFGDIYIPNSLCYYVFSNSLIAVFLVLTRSCFHHIQTRGCATTQRNATEEVKLSSPLHP